MLVAGNCFVIIQPHAIPMSDDIPRREMVLALAALDREIHSEIYEDLKNE